MQPRHLFLILLSMTIGLPALAQPPGMFGGPGMGPGMGPPMGPFGGGPPMMGGSSFRGGGDRGGGDRGGGDRGGGDRGSRGGFDPSSFLTRLDTNGNGSIDPDEMQGSARFFLDRMAQGNPKIDLSKPIPLSTISSEFERMRAERSGGEGGYSSSWGNSSSSEETAEKAIVLVPGFASPKKADPIPGFGASTEMFSVQVEDRDLAESEDRIRRYDQNRDLQLDENELKQGSWRDNPMQYDRNRDGKLSKDELGVRYARRRIAEQSSSTASSTDRRDDRTRNRGVAAEAPKEEPSPLERWKSTAFYNGVGTKGKEAKTSGLPGWFLPTSINADQGRDADGDGQVTMNEFSAKWDASVLEEFQRFDTNKDGSITAQECLIAGKNGVLLGSAASPSTSSSTSSSVAKTDSSNQSREGFPPDADEKWVKWINGKIAEYDKNKNRLVSVDEWPPSSGDFSKIDTNSDGQISAGEFYLFKKPAKK